MLRFVCFLQSASGIGLPTGFKVISYVDWLDNLFPGIPDSILRTHPFYRYPENNPALGSRSFSTPVAASFAKTQRTSSLEISKCWNILKKPSLTSMDVDQLLAHAERLCGYACGSMKVSRRRAHASSAIDTLGTAFLVMDTLHCAAEVLGDKSMKESWWPWMVSHIESASYEPRRDFVTIGKRSRNVDVASTLHVALDFYRRGLRAPLRMVIGLKEALLCEPGASSKFKAERWNPWREDAARWRRSIEPSLSWHK